MNRDEAAILLGVPPHADPNEIRQAWRMWARIAHPDVNGDPAHFVRLETARRTLLRPCPAPAIILTPTPRTPWSQVMRWPAHLAALLIVGIMSILLAALAGIPQVPLGVTVAACAVAAATWASWVTREILSKTADHGHRITVLALSWMPIAFAQVLVSVAVSASFVPVLPLLALPLVAAVASVNPGAGLWRPIGR